MVGRTIRSKCRTLPHACKYFITMSTQQSCRKEGPLNSVMTLLLGFQDKNISREEENFSKKQHPRTYAPTWSRADREYVCPYACDDRFCAAKPVRVVCSSLSCFKPGLFETWVCTGNAILRNLCFPGISQYPLTVTGLPCMHACMYVRILRG